MRSDLTVGCDNRLFGLILLRFSSDVIRRTGASLLPTRIRCRVGLKYQVSIYFALDNTFDERLRI